MIINGTPQEYPSYGWIEFTDRHDQRQKHLLLEHRLERGHAKSLDPATGQRYHLSLGPSSNVVVTFW